MRSAHGFKGEVFVRLFAGAADWRSGVTSLALLTDGASELRSSPLKSSRPHKDGLLIVFADAQDRDAAEALEGAQVYLADEALEAGDGERIFLRQILGFTVTDEAGLALGEITGFATNGAQDLLVLRRASDGGRALVPLVDEFLIAIESAEKRVRMTLPPGLLQLD